MLLPRNAFDSMQPSADDDEAIGGVRALLQLSYAVKRSID
jgi:hypothetical protein